MTASKKHETMVQEEISHQISQPAAQQPPSSWNNMAGSVTSITAQ